MADQHPGGDPPADDREREEPSHAEPGPVRFRPAIALGTAALVALVGAGVWRVVAGDGGGAAGHASLTAAAVTEARTAASCEVVDRTAEFDTNHYPSLDLAPPPEEIYRVRPPHGGRHPAQVAPVTPVASEQLDEVATTHNLEHGSVIVWYDPALDAGVVGDIRAWARGLDEAGFTNAEGGAGVMVSPYADPGLPPGTAVAMRAWGVAVDCGEWNRTAANGFVLEHYGTHGAAPEADRFAPYPEGTITWEGEPPVSPAPAAAPAGETERGVVRGHPQRP